MNPDHAGLLDELRAAARPTSRERLENNSYGGSGHPFFNVSAPARRAIARRWIAEHRTMPADAFLAVVEGLTRGQSHEEKTLAAILLAYHPQVRRTVRPDDVDRWLGHLNGWAEIDCLCHNVFTAADLSDDWPVRKQQIERLALAPDINKRRASLVLLNGPVHSSDDERFPALALANVKRLEAERHILITKAVSWLLRSMIARHRGAVERCLAEDRGTLPRVAVRETRAKLATGVKSGRPRSSKP